MCRVSGRASHIAKLRSEFDSGADYDMSECGPSDLDPHAVASVLKAYLRECKSTVNESVHFANIDMCIVPEPLLTRALMPLFE